MTDGVTTDIKLIEQRNQLSVYLMAASAVSLVLASVAVVNFINKQFILGSFEVLLILFFLSTIPYAKKQSKSVELLGSILLYATAGFLLFLIYDQKGQFPAAFAGLAGLILVAYLMTRAKYSLLVFATIIYMLFLALSLSGAIGLSIEENVKYQVVYVATMLALYFKQKLDRQKRDDSITANAKIGELNERLGESLVAADQANARFYLATSAASIGVWEWKIGPHELVWDDQMFQLYGVSRELTPDVFDIWQKAICHEDAKYNEDAIQEALKGRKEYDVVYRVIWPNGQTHFLKSRAKVIRDKHGKPIQMIGVIWDITKEKLIDLEKTEFVSLASHQLKTPLTAISWYAEILLKQKQDLKSDQLKYITEIATGNHRMIELVNALLNVSRLELGTVSIEPKSVDLSEVFSSIEDEFSHKIKHTKQTLSISIDSKIPNIYTDEQLFRIVVQNLISNAVKYSPEKAKIVVKVGFSKPSKTSKAPASRGIVVSVQDNGYGIPEDAQARIFEKLYRAENIKTLNTDGTGLGLYMSKLLAEALHGKLWFDSKVGNGTTFYLRIPISANIHRAGSKSLESKPEL